jgi:hypothetical protein
MERLAAILPSESTESQILLFTLSQRLNRPVGEARTSLMPSPQEGPPDGVRQSSTAASLPRTACGGLIPIAPRSVSKHTVLRQTHLRESALWPHADNLRLGLDFRPLTSAGFDLTYAVQDFLPYIALGLECGECLAGQLSIYVGISTLTPREFAQSTYHSADIRVVTA